MAFVWKPAIWDPTPPGSLYELPRPVISLVVQDRWSFERLKVPLVDGETRTGHSQDGVVIRLEGQLGTQAGAFKATEEQMFAELENLRAKLDVQSDSDKYELFLYHDAASSTYRKLKKCTTAEFRYDLSRVHLFTYMVVIEADDPVIYTTGPGA